MKPVSAESDRQIINNQFYDELGHDWYQGEFMPLTLLRAENRCKLEWLIPRLDPQRLKGLDVGCGGGLVTNPLARLGYQMTGLDYSAGSLEVARQHAPKSGVDYVQGDAYALPFSDQSFDFVICFDFLEHVSAPARVIAECSRVLKDSGVLFFHTFNRNWLSWLFAAKGLEWFVRDTPRDLHVYSLFIKPSELEVMLQSHRLHISSETGIRPRFDLRFLRLLATGIVSERFSFTTTGSKAVSYMGSAIKV